MLSESPEQSPIKSTLWLCTPGIAARVDAEFEEFEFWNGIYVHVGVSM